MLTIYQLPPAFDIPVSVSPFCTKLEVYMRLTNREYTTELGDLRKSPNKKMPYVAGLKGGMIADSAAIISILERKGPRLDSGISPEEIELANEMEALAQGDLYYACLYARFAAPEGWVHLKPMVKGLVPWVLSPVLAPVIRKSQVKLCAENGFSDDGGYPAALKGVMRIVEILGEKDFLLGEAPRIVDCSIWSILMHSSQTLSSNPVREVIRGNQRLMAYINRMARRADVELPGLR